MFFNMVSKLSSVSGGCAAAAGAIGFGSPVFFSGAGWSARDIAIPVHATRAAVNNPDMCFFIGGSFQEWIFKRFSSGQRLYEGLCALAAGRYEKNTAENAERGGANTAAACVWLPEHSRLQSRLGTASSHLVTNHE
jgi:hypothetical protein